MIDRIKVNPILPMPRDPTQHNYTPVSKIENACMEIPPKDASGVTVDISPDHYVKLALRLLRDAHNQFSVVHMYRGDTYMSEDDKEHLRQYLKELSELVDKV